MRGVERVGKGAGGRGKEGREGIQKPQCNADGRTSLYAL